ncbi:Hypothetical predicted protein [Olea europaea subsp. europaea]|uniref:Uncharacterized protein n=1 Tax=Olea europaea subsp. europaea TaxID=158383 RepID=A0A8S0U5X6_OLEEU|nr:Hypothetical predicted protein [Olea europaea subsp. europaea]
MVAVLGVAAAAAAVAMWGGNFVVVDLAIGVGSNVAVDWRFTSNLQIHIAAVMAMEERERRRETKGKGATASMTQSTTGLDVNLQRRDVNLIC